MLNIDIKTKIKRIILIIVIIYLVIMSLPATAMSLAGLLNSIEPKTKPEITYYEFPVEITYKSEDKTITISDTYICEFICSWPCRGEWEGYVKSGGPDKFVLIENDDIIIDYSLGSPEYYMGDDPKYFPSFRVFKKDNVEFVTIEELEVYGISIVEYNLPEPIKNTFEVESVPTYVFVIIAVLMYASIIVLVIAVIKKMRQKPEQTEKKGDDNSPS